MEATLMPSTSRNPRQTRSAINLFLISFLLLFLELACIRWLPAHVVFLTFFTNVILLACFLGMSVGCLVAKRERHYMMWTPLLLVIVMWAAQAVNLQHWKVMRAVDVGEQSAPQMVFFGTEHLNRDLAHFTIPIEIVNGLFFLLAALALIGPGQELGRALGRLPNRILAYTINILGSMAGIALFAVYSWCELSPFWWFLPIVLGLGYFLVPHLRAARSLRPVLGNIALLLAILGFASWTSGSYSEKGRTVGEHFWSPYYRVDYDQAPSRTIHVNLISHQKMVGLDDQAYYDESTLRAGRSAPTAQKPTPVTHTGSVLPYALPHMLRRDAFEAAGEQPRTLDNVLIIGAGSGNDVTRALQWGAKHIDAVEIDPVVQRLGFRDHPDHPYQDPRVTVHLDDGRNFLRSTDQQYDLVIYALVDSLVLHSSYSNIRLESYLFTREAFADVRRHLKPDGQFVMYNFFRQGWIVARLDKGVAEVFGEEPLVLTFPDQPTVEPEKSFGGYTVLFAGATERLRQAFTRFGSYRVSSQQAPSPTSPNGFLNPPSPSVHFGLANVIQPAEPLRVASDDWPFLYLRQPMIPALSLRGAAIMSGIAIILLAAFLRKTPTSGRRWSLNGRMFFLGAGFMLIETKAVVHMALLFGSTWMVNAIVFFAVLAMILAANLFVLIRRPRRLWMYYVGLLLMLALNCVVPLDSFLGMNRILQIGGACLLVFIPIWFAGVIFAVSFDRSEDSDRAFGANIAGAMFGGLAEYSSMLLGFQYLVLVALGFYLLSALLGVSKQRWAAAFEPSRQAAAALIRRGLWLPAHK